MTPPSPDNLSDIGRQKMSDGNLVERLNASARWFGGERPLATSPKSMEEMGVEEASGLSELLREAAANIVREPAVTDEAEMMDAQLSTGRGLAERLDELATGIHTHSKTIGEFSRAIEERNKVMTQAAALLRTLLSDREARKARIGEIVADIEEAARIRAHDWPDDLASAYRRIAASLRELSPVNRDTQKTAEPSK